MAIGIIRSPTEDYERKKFVSKMYGLGQLEAILEGLSKPEGNWDPNLRKGLGYLKRDDQTFYNEMTPDLVQNDAQEFVSEHKKNIIKYAENKWEILLDKIDKEDLVSLVLSLPLVKTDNRTYDEIKQIIDEKRKIAMAEQNGAIENYVNEKLSRASESRRQAYFGYAMGSQLYTQRTFNAYKRDTEIDLLKAISKDKEIDKKKLIGLIKANYERIIRDEEDKEDSKLAKTYRYNIAKYTFQGELKKAKDVRNLIEDIEEEYEEHYDPINQ